MKLITLFLFPSLLFPIIAAQLSCPVTKPFPESTFISAFRNGYKDEFGTTEPFNLKKHAQIVYAKAAFEKESNRGGNCLERAAYTEQLCKDCVKRLGWRVDSALFNYDRDNQRAFIKELRKRVCELNDPCKRRPRPSVSPMPRGPYTATVVSNDTVNALVSYRFAVVAEQWSTRFFYSVADISGVTDYWPFQGVFVEYAVEQTDVEFFECVQSMLDRPGLGNMAAEAIRADCYARGEGFFNEGCADWRLGAEVCDGLRALGCVPSGQVFISQCK